MAGPGSFPDVTLGRGQWEKAVRILRGVGTKEADELARKIEAQALTRWSAGGRLDVEEDPQ